MVEFAAVGGRVRRMTDERNKGTGRDPRLKWVKDVGVCEKWV